MAETKSKLAAVAAAATKRILGASLPAPQTVKMPKAVHRIHVSRRDVIPAGTLLTQEIIELVGISAETLTQLVSTGAVVEVDVLAAAVEAPSEPQAQA